MIGPTSEFSDYIHNTKYRNNETFYEAMSRIASALTETEIEYFKFREILLHMRFLPAGRIQAAAGSPRRLTAFNCYVSGVIEDSMPGIMQAATDAAMTMRMGGGIGYDFSTLRPRGSLIRTLGSQASGPVSFMRIFDTVCGTVASAGHRRGAQMGILRIDHPDIEQFVTAKQDESSLTNFNISVAVTDEFMNCLINNEDFPLKWEGKTISVIKPHYLWEKIMRSTKNWAEPGVIFIDTVNRMNNLWYCETISATNPCSEQPLPPNGACLLGSFNLVKYLGRDSDTNKLIFKYHQLIEDIYYVVRAMDRVIDTTIYPLPAQHDEAVSKRRMGLGVTGLANAIEALGYSYGSEGFLNVTRSVFQLLANQIYITSANLAKERGSFPLYDEARYLKSKFVETLEDFTKEQIYKYGIRNSHLLSVAPTGTISLSADNVSSGIEPVFNYSYERTVNTFDGPVVHTIHDYGYRYLNVKGKLTSEVSLDEHVAVLNAVTPFVDSSISKTCNVPFNTSWENFKGVYRRAWELGIKCLSTFSLDGKRQALLRDASGEEFKGVACTIDPDTGKKTCDE